MNSETLRKNLTELKTGERVMVNAINLTFRGIQTIRELIQLGIIKPDIEEAKKIYKDVNKIMSGEVIAPQMDYIRQ